jgi:adenosylcobinamide-GDP ribazoletransferase
VNALWLALGTLTVFPVPAPTSVERRVAGWAMTLAPVVALPLAAIPVVVVTLDGPPLLLAALAVATLAVLSRAIHLDGLADTADGLGSGRRAADALMIMRKSDIGPFGVAALVLTLLVQVTAVASLDDAWAVGAAVVVSRGMLPLVCVRLFAPARVDGLGATVAGSVSWWQAGLALAMVAGVSVAAGASYALVGLLAGLAPALHCRRHP